ncbi:hypothetical protein EV182_006564, partial [Spiromyces aspiralis]
MSFVECLFNLIEDPSTDDWIHWCWGGKAFRFKSLQKLFEHRDLLNSRATCVYSLNKNLNDYSIIRRSDNRKRPDTSDMYGGWEIFEHEYLLQGRRDLVVN